MRVAEYFAGIGLARLGLEAAGMTVAWANDLSPRKQAMYAQRFRPPYRHSGYTPQDVTSLTTETDPPPVEVAWASFPCTDLSLAGSRGGLNTGSSAAFWGFVSSVERMGANAPAVVALENVPGLATSHGGRDIHEAISTLNRLGYFVDVLSIDARRFVPQSRSRLFLVGAKVKGEESLAPHEFRPRSLDAVFADPTLRTFRHRLPEAPEPQHRGFSALVSDLGENGHAWWDEHRLSAFLESLAPGQSRRLADLKGAGRMVHRTAYRRMRHGVPRWEIRADDIAGCLRTPRGGSSRQAVLRISGESVQVRWMTPAEYASLMGGHGFDLNAVSPSDAQWGFGDAVCVPVVTWLAEHVLSPSVAAARLDQAEVGMY